MPTPRSRTRQRGTEAQIAAGSGARRLALIAALAEALIGLALVAPSDVRAQPLKPKPNRNPPAARPIPLAPARPVPRHAAPPPLSTPAQGTPAQGTPAEGTPAEGTPAEGTPAEGTPAERAAVRQVVEQFLAAVARHDVPAALQSCTRRDRRAWQALDTPVRRALGAMLFDVPAGATATWQSVVFGATEPRLRPPSGATPDGAAPEALPAVGTAPAPGAGHPWAVATVRLEAPGRAALTRRLLVHERARGWRVVLGLGALAPLPTPAEFARELPANAALRERLVTGELADWQRRCERAVADHDGHTLLTLIGLADTARDRGVTPDLAARLVLFAKEAGDYCYSIPPEAASPAGADPPVEGLAIQRLLRLRFTEFADDDDDALPEVPAVLVRVLALARTTSGAKTQTLALALAHDNGLEPLAATPAELVAIAAESARLLLALVERTELAVAAIGADRADAAVWRERVESTQALVPAGEIACRKRLAALAEKLAVVLAPKTTPGDSEQPQPQPQTQPDDPEPPHAPPDNPEVPPAPPGNPETPPRVPETPPASGPAAALSQPRPQGRAPHAGHRRSEPRPQGSGCWGVAPLARSSSLTTLECLP